MRYNNKSKTVSLRRIKEAGVIGSMAGAKRKKVTIVDVAAKAGVSKTTISRYLNGKFEYMSEESRQRIADVIEELGYRPNSLARSLKSKQSFVLGVIVSDITSPFSPILLKGISDCCDRYGYRILIANSDDEPRKERDYIMNMIDQSVDGIILNTTGGNDEFLRETADMGMKFVLADRTIDLDLFDTVHSADRDAIGQMMRYLKGVGYESVGFFTQPLTNSTRINRCQIFREVYGSYFDGMAQVYFLEKKQRDANVMQEFMRRNIDTKHAIFTGNGVATMRVVQTMRDLGIYFPQETGLCGFDDWEWMNLVGGGLTTIALPTYEVGKECVKRMMHLLNYSRAGESRQVELPCTLQIRHST